MTIALKNFFWVPNCSNWNVSNLFCDFRKVGYKTAQGNLPNAKAHSLKVVSSPLDCQAPFTIKKDNITQKFYLSYHKDNDERLKCRIKKVIKYAVREKAEIVCFPEMMGTSSLIQECKEVVSSYVDNLSATRPKLFFLPSCEYCENGLWYNRLDILDDNGACIFHYFKKHPFTLDRKTKTNDGKMIEVKFHEPITADKEICIIHVPEIGRIGVVICADVFKESYLQFLMKDLQLTLLILPVYSSGVDLMQRSLAEAMEYSCDILLCNTCAAWDNAELPLAVRAPNNDYTHEFITVYYPFGHSSPFDKQSATARCTAETCEGCLFLTVISPQYRDPPTPPEQVRLEAI